MDDFIYLFIYAWWMDGCRDTCRCSCLLGVMIKSVSSCFLPLLPGSSTAIIALPWHSERLRCFLLLLTSVFRGRLALGCGESSEVRTWLGSLSLTKHCKTSDSYRVQGSGAFCVYTFRYSGYSEMHFATEFYWWCSSEKTPSRLKLWWAVVLLVSQI